MVVCFAKYRKVYIFASANKKKMLSHSKPTTSDGKYDEDKRLLRGRKREWR